MAQAAVLITYRELMRRVPTRDQLHNVLKKYRRREFVTLLGQLNCLLETWQNAPNFDIDTRLSALLLSRHNYEIESMRASTDRRVVFSRLGLLYLVKQACVACPDDGLLVNTEDARNDVGVCCLMANDLLLPFMPSPSDGTIQKISNLLPFADYIGHDQYPYDIGRTLLMFTEVSREPSLRTRADFLDLYDLFERHVGLSVETFCQLIFGCAVKFLNVNLEQLRQSSEELFLRSSFFDKTAIDPQMIQVFLRKVAISDQELKERILQAANRPENDLTIFQAHPMLQFAADIYVCLDPGFLTDKAGRGAFWTLFAELPDNKTKLRALSFWGAVFEEYVNRILRQSYAGGWLLESPKFANGNEAFDACAVEGWNLVVFEHKSSTLRADAKYGGDPNELKKQLHLKFIEGDEEGKKGVAQLSTSVESFLQGEAFEDVANDQISKVFSVLVCLDNSVTIPFVGKYFNEQFRALSLRKKFRRTTITPLFTLGISDLENLLGYLASLPFSDILESYYKNNRGMLTSLSRSRVPLLLNAQPGKNPVQERFVEFGRAMERELFGVDEDRSSAVPKENDAVTDL